MPQSLDEYFNKKKDIGQRFKIFRQLIQKSHEELGEELNYEPVKIKIMEKGGFIPDILFLEYFFREYGLNLTWLVNGTETILCKEAPNIPGSLFEFCQENPPDSDAFKEYLSSCIRNSGESKG